MVQGEVMEEKKNFDGLQAELKATGEMEDKKVIDKYEIEQRKKLLEILNSDPKDLSNRLSEFHKKWDEDLENNFKDYDPDEAYAEYRTDCLPAFKGILRSVRESRFALMDFVNMTKSDDVRNMAEGVSDNLVNLWSYVVRGDDASVILSPKCRLAEQLCMEAVNNCKGRIFNDLGMTAEAAELEAEQAKLKKAWNMVDNAAGEAEISTGGQGEELCGVTTESDKTAEKKEPDGQSTTSKDPFDGYTDINSRAYNCENGTYLAICRKSAEGVYAPYRIAEFSKETGQLKRFYAGRYDGLVRPEIRGGKMFRDEDAALHELEDWAWRHNRTVYIRKESKMTFEEVVSDVQTRVVDGLCDLHAKHDDMVMSGFANGQGNWQESVSLYEKDVDAFFESSKEGLDELKDFVSRTDSRREKRLADELVVLLEGIANYNHNSINFLTDPEFYKAGEKFTEAVVEVPNRINYSFLVAVQDESNELNYVTGINEDGLPEYEPGAPALVMKEQDANELSKDMLDAGIPTVTLIVHNNLCKIPCNEQWNAIEVEQNVQNEVQTENMTVSEDNER